MTTSGTGGTRYEPPWLDDDESQAWLNVWSLMVWLPARLDAHADRMLDRVQLRENLPHVRRAIETPAAVLIAVDVEDDLRRELVRDVDLDLEIDHAETQRRRQGAQARLDTLNQAAPDGEITL